MVYVMQIKKKKGGEMDSGVWKRGRFEAEKRRSKTFLEVTKKENSGLGIVKDDFFSLEKI